MKYYTELYAIASNVKSHPIPKLFNTLESLKYFKNYWIIEWLCQFLKKD